MIYQYTWGPSYGVITTKSVSAQAVGERLEQLREQVGDGITPAQVLDDARPNDSPTHNLFEWRNTKAAEQWRLHQARHVIGCLRIKVPDELQDSDTAPRTILANISVMDGEDRVYHSSPVVAVDDTLREWAIQNALAYLEGFEERFKNLNEMLPVLEAIQRVRAAQQPHSRRRRTRSRQTTSVD